MAVWFDFWCLWEVFERFLEGFGRHFGAFGWPVAVCWRASALKRIHVNFFNHRGWSWSDFVCLWGSFGRLLERFGDHLGAFGLPVAVFWGASAGKFEIVKSDVLCLETQGF